MNLRSLVRVTGFAAVTAAAFAGCGGRNEAEYADSGADTGGPNCGNGRIDRDEECDGKLLGGATCRSATLNVRPNGSVTCKKCQVDTSTCTGSGSSGTGGAGNGSGGRFGTGGGIGTGTGGGVGTGTGGRVGGGGMNAGGAASGCTSSGDCSRGQVCCGTRTGNQYAFACAASCRNGTTAECHQASDCGRGQVCCGTTNMAGTDYTSMACARTCNATGERAVCASSQECPQGTTCRTSRVLPSAFKVCQ